EMPLAASIEEGVPKDVRVDIVIDGQTAHQVTLNDGRWRAVRIEAPSSIGRYWRVDLRVAPTWSPFIVLPPSPDKRELGVAVGEIAIEPGKKIMGNCG